jgi:anthraniloyl-CoA monooxygenase
MDRADRDRIRSAFVRAAERADAAGFDYCQVHLGNGYLLSSFLSPVTNARDDEFGGRLEDRCRFPAAVVSAVREAWPADKPLGVTLQATDRVDGGLTLEDAIAVGDRLVDAGADLVAPVAGGVSTDEPADAIYGLANYADHLGHALDVPAMATVQATTADEVNTLVATGRAALCTYYGAFESLT